MDNKVIKRALTLLLTEIADKARSDALKDESDIGYIFRREDEDLQSLDPTTMREAISMIEQATATKQGAQHLINGIMIAIHAAAKLA